MNTSTKRVVFSVQRVDFAATKSKMYTSVSEGICYSAKTRPAVELPHDLKHQTYIKNRFQLDCIISENNILNVYRLQNLHYFTNNKIKFQENGSFKHQC